LQHDGDPERGERNAHHREDAQDVIRPGVVVQRRDDAQRHAEEHRDRQRAEGELQRRRQALGDVERHRPVRKCALAQVEVGDLFDIDGELLPDRPVEAVLLAQALDLLGRRRVARHGHGGIRRHGVDQQEGDDQQAQQRGHHQGAAPEDEAQHHWSPIH
jgi:hypothetical protein